MTASYTPEELRALARSVELFEELHITLGAVEAFPRDHFIHIHSEIDPFYLGVIGFDEGGCVTFQPRGALE